VIEPPHRAEQAGEEDGHGGAAKAASIHGEKAVESYR
jgi:hypothetical protein